MIMMIWSWGALVAAIYCISRSITDLRRGHYVWGAIGIVSALVFILSPIETHAVKLDLPVDTSR